MQHNASLDGKSAANTAVSGRDLRNSRSMATSGARKEVFSKTKILNEQGIPVTHQHQFVTNHNSNNANPISEKSSKFLYNDTNHLHLSRP